MDKIKLAIVGLGNIAQLAHLPLAKERKDVDLIVVDKRKKQTHILAEKYGATAAYTDIKSVLTNPPAAVILAVPDALHVPYITQFLSAGCYILCEKPISDSVAGYLAGKSAIESHPGKITVGYMWRHTPVIERLHDVLSSDNIQGQTGGRIVSVEEYFQTGGYNSWMGGFKPTKKGLPHRTKVKVSGKPQYSLTEKLFFNWMNNVWSHQINLSRWFFGDAESVSDVKVWHFGNKFIFSVHYASGIKSNASFSWTKGHEHSRGFRLIYPAFSINVELGTPGDPQLGPWIEVNANSSDDETAASDFITILEKTGIKISEKNSTPATWHYRIQFERFIEKVKAGLPLDFNLPEDAIKDTAFAEAVVASYHNGESRHIELP